ncbi:membrane-bound lytic murein transglycosylase F [Methylohalomonas lacus]|uniref:Membrane-bound lytic murein transglycosylase F n=1 Tax=Methylohalomonas lacus TaxID=398773 RepID=A0AAE3HN62_9GAMM|nr:transporter substrate-binding domain-containing protein [Methylohalomonas lacus]MCS3904199.1 membrane-bound lytic murein transglycosylase F [Methylohalomonas lacus]
MLSNNLTNKLLHRFVPNDHVRPIVALCLLGIVLTLGQAGLMLSTGSYTEGSVATAKTAAHSNFANSLDDARHQPPQVSGRILPLVTAALAAADDRLRVLAQRRPGQPQQPALAGGEIQLLEDYAAAVDRELVWILVDSASELVPALQSGQGDLIAGQHEYLNTGTLTAAELTQPWSVSRQRLVIHRDGAELASLAELTAGSIAVPASSPARPLLQNHAAEHAELDIVVVDTGQTSTDMLRKVVQGEYDMAVADSAVLADYLPHQPQLDVAFDLPEAQNLAWAVHPEADDLRQSIDSYLSREALSRSVADVRFDDLPGITERRQLRVITYQSPANYYLADNGELRGFEYDLIRRFAREHDLRVEVVVAPSQQDMVRWLLEGRGDLIAASVPAASVRNNPKLSVSRPYNYAAPLIVGRDSDDTLLDARDLDGRRIVLPAGSPHKRLLERYQQRGIAVDVVTADDNQSLGEILQRVAKGIYDLTVVDSHKSQALLAADKETQAHFPISEPLPHGWLMRDDDQQLLMAVNDYLAETYRSRDYNVLYARYFEQPIRYTPLEKSTDRLLALGGELSPYDELVRRYADEFGFDWRLIVAQMYQESRFDPAAQSSAGAIGLMQLLPTTADDLGFTELYQPESSIHAGVSYLNYLYKRFDEALAFEDRIWLSLAAYNAGYSRVEQARQRAREMGLDANRWFDNVEKAMLTMRNDTTCSCGQPVAYVREIRSRYHSYVRLTRLAQYAARDSRAVSHDT